MKIAKIEFHTIADSLCDGWGPQRQASPSRSSSIRLMAVSAQHERVVRKNRFERPTPTILNE